MERIIKGMEGIKGEVVEIKEVEINPIVEVRRKIAGSLVIERTPEKPVTEIKSYNIVDIKKKIAKIDAVIKIWEDKKKPLQAILDEYETIQ